MAIKKSDEQILNLLKKQALRLSHYEKDASVIRETMEDDIREFEESTQVVLRFEFVDDVLQVIVEDRSKDAVTTSFNSTDEKLLLRAQLNNVPIDVMIFRKGKNDSEPPLLSLRNAEVAAALLELSELVRRLPTQMVAMGNAKWSLVPGEGALVLNSDAPAEPDVPVNAETPLEQPVEELLSGAPLVDQEAALDVA